MRGKKYEKTLGVAEAQLIMVFKFYPELCCKILSREVTGSTFQDSSIKNRV